VTRRWDRRRRLLIGATTIVLLGAAVFVVRAAWPNDRARSVDASEALERYREATADATVADEPSSSSSAPPVDPPAALPPAGVYRYRTSGSESIDALGGTSHTYPAETTLTVTANGCGVRLRWDVLVERREEWRLCLGDDGIELPPLAASYHEFYGTGRLETQTCDGAVLLLPTDERPRPPVEWFCTLGDHEWLPTWQVLERDTLRVEGRPVAVTHVQMTVTDDDHYSSTPSSTGGSTSTACPWR